MAVIEVDNLTKRFTGLTAVDDVTFAVEQASVVGFLGPNGAGKTTTLRMLLGLVTPTSGTAMIPWDASAVSTAGEAPPTTGGWASSAVGARSILLF